MHLNTLIATIIRTKKCLSLKKKKKYDFFLASASLVTAPFPSNNNNHQNVAAKLQQTATADLPGLCESRNGQPKYYDEAHHYR